MSNAFDVMSADVMHGAHIGQGVVDGFECEHLAFRNDDTDWQLWVQIGDAPIPRKYVITSKTEAGAPAVHLGHQGMENRCAAERRCVRVQGAGRREEARCGGARRPDEVPPRIANGREEMNARSRKSPQIALAAIMGVGVLLVNDSCRNHDGRSHVASRGVDRTTADADELRRASRGERPAAPDGHGAPGYGGAHGLRSPVTHRRAIKLVDAYGRVFMQCP